MQALPITLVSIDQGVPFLKNRFSFLLSSENQKDFSIQTSKVGDEELFLICLTTKENSNLSIEENVSYAGPIGYLCKYIEQSSVSLDEGTGLAELCEIVCQPLSYIEFGNIYKDSANTLKSTYTKITIEKSIADEKLEQDLKEFLIFVCGHINNFPLQSIDAMKDFDSALDICDEIVKVFFEDNFEKYAYIQNTVEIDRIRSVTTYLLDVNNDFISLNMKDFTLLSTLRRSRNIGKNSYSTTAEPPQQPTTSSASFPKNITKILMKEKQKLNRLPSSSLEYQAVLSYIETLESIPWLKHAEKVKSLKTLVTSINSTHYGLTDVKKHVLEHLVLENHLCSPMGTVLCFVGPPGTGKTSIAKSIAKATGRKTIRIALGGVTDEAEIRGHRRTYVAAKQGRIVDGLIASKQMNPVIILDEVDKLDKGVRGDPTSALLELLDPEQNTNFIDRYIEAPIDLSQVFFICTANYEEQIPPALKDRLEIIYFKDYNKQERLSILKDYIYPAVIKRYNMESFEIEIKDCFYDKFSEEHSVRKIEKNISKLLKIILVKFLIDKASKITLSSDTYNLLTKKTSTSKKIGFKK